MYSFYSLREEIQTLSEGGGLCSLIQTWPVQNLLVKDFISKIDLKDQKRASGYSTEKVSECTFTNSWTRRATRKLEMALSFSQSQGSLLAKSLPKSPCRLFT